MSETVEVTVNPETNEVLINIVEAGTTPRIVVEETAETNITLSDAHNAIALSCTSSTAVSIIIPDGLPYGFNTVIFQSGTGQITFSAGEGCVLNSYSGLLKTAGRHAGVTVLKIKESTYNLRGDMA